MRYSLFALLVVAGLLYSTAVPSMAQSRLHPQAAPSSVITPWTPPASMPSEPGAYKTQAIDTVLFYYEDATFLVALGTEDGQTYQAAGLFFEAPFDGQVERIDFAVFNTEGTGTLRIKLMPPSFFLPEDPFEPGIDSVDVDLADLTESAGVTQGNLPNKIDVSAADFEIEEDESYFLVFLLVDASPNAAVELIVDGGSEDEDDDRYFPARSWLYIDDGADPGFFIMSDPNSDRTNSNFLVEIALSEAPPPPPPPAALLQVVHNAPSPETVDIYVGGERVADDLAYQQATSFVSVLAGDEQTIEVVEGNAEDASAPLLSTTATLTEDGSYLAMTYGVPGEDFDVSVADLSTASNTTALFGHGGLGAGLVDLRILDDTPDHQPVSTLVDDLALGELRGPLSVEVGTFNIELTSADATTPYDVFRVELSAPDDTTASVFIISGTVDAGLTLLRIEADGTVTMPDVNTATDDPAAVPGTFALHTNYPNPFNPTTTITFDLGTPAYTTLRVFDLTGRAVATLVAAPLTAGRHEVVFDAGGLPSGAYVYRLESGSLHQQRLLMLVK